MINGSYMVVDAESYSLENATFFETFERADKGLDYFLSEHMKGGVYYHTPPRVTKREPGRLYIEYDDQSTPSDPIVYDYRIFKLQEVTADA